MKSADSYLRTLHHAENFRGFGIDTYTICYDPKTDFKIVKNQYHPKSLTSLTLNFLQAKLSQLSGNTIGSYQISPSGNITFTYPTNEGHFSRIKFFFKAIAKHYGCEFRYTSLANSMRGNRLIVQPSAFTLYFPPVDGIEPIQLLTPC